MSRTEVAEVVSSFRGVVLRDTTSNLGQMVATKGSTRIWLKFGDNGLTITGATWGNGIKASSYSLRRHLCSHQLGVLVVLHAPTELAGAHVFLDDVPVGLISSQGSRVIDVALGSHELRIEKEGYAGWTAIISYEERSSGYEHLSVPRLAKTSG